MAEKADGLNGTNVPFITSDDSRRDSETCWLLDVRSLTNPSDSRIRRIFHRAELDRTGLGEDRMRTGYFLGLSPSDILVDCTRVSTCPICPINKCTFVWHNFSP